ncbi:non-hydrolyzing UDP-N-acetylglucosamine 2-epimerase [Flexithrix dorotheae]|uniref:non-hydrolyzing UDP-N-acetylglucosamine 2-epimerase n=1 Tax=Flexithrix dorotheae TaxID=70993 RepID=UPI00037A95EA|nr:UDP-N-acetylglucosamine 2-epimerase (non-hydrolyzing) [Flexithrix dorotheae]
MQIDLIAGARPNFMKIAPIIDAIKAQQNKGRSISFRLVHTGQHYDKKMSGDFFDELGIPQPDVNLGAGGGTQAEQTAKIMIGYEKLLFEKGTDLCLVVGDVTSTMACAIVAKKLNVKVAHVEAGIRSGDLTMPEEINRMVTDSITDYFFTTSKVANRNLLQLGIPENRIFFVGNTMIDTLLKKKDDFQKPDVWEEVGLKEAKYIVMTLHRPGNVDEEEKLKIMIETIVLQSQGMPIIFPVHPRTQQVLDRLGIKAPNFNSIPPLGYLAFNFLVKNAKVVITDSGGITEETTVLGVPCMTLRDNTERPETITQGTNELIGTLPENLKPAFEKLFAGNWKKGSIPEKWDGKAAKRIIEHLIELG